MARIEDIPEPTRANIVALDCPTPATRPWVQGAPLSERRVAIISSAALFARGEDPLPPGSAGFKELPAALATGDILMSHPSINYDRVGWQRDINTIYPIDRLKELAAEGVIGSVGDRHYAFMGSTDPKMMEETADSIVERLKRDRIDAILFSPV